MKKLKIFSILAILLLTAATLFSCSEKNPCKDGHTFGEPEVVRQANCHDMGQYKYSCTVCHYSEMKDIDRTEHNFVDGVCSICGDNGLKDMTFELNADGQSYKLKEYRDTTATTVTVPATYGGKPVTVIGVGALDSMESLESITLPDSIVEIERSAFSCDYKLKSINLPEGLKKIDDSVFMYCRALEDIQIPSTVETIGAHTFSNCEALDELILPEGLKSLGEYAFANTPITEMTIPAGVTEIPAELFDGCKALKTVTMLGEITKIGSSAFGGLSSLERVTAKGTPELEKGAFSYCVKLHMLDIEGGVGNIGENAFSNCYSLNSITLSESLQSIGDNAFRNCERLALVRNYSSLTINSQNNPGNIRDRLRFMTTDVNDNRGRIEYVNDFVILVVDSDHIKTDQTVEKHRSYYLIDYVGTDVAPVFPTFETPEEYTVDGYTIAKYAFHDYYNGEENILFADLPVGVTSIEEQAFFRCNRLLRIYVPYTVTYASPYIYSTGIDSSLVEVINCRPDVYVPESTGNLLRYWVEYDRRAVELASDIFTIDDFAILRLGSEWHLLGYLGDEKVLNIPAPAEGIDYYIHYNAFKNYNAEGVVLPEGLLEIREHAFEGKFILTDLTFPSSLKKIGYEAFKGATFGDLVIPDNVEEIGNGAFDGATFNSITLPVGADIDLITDAECGEDGFLWFGSIIVRSNRDTVSGDVVIKDGAVQLVNSLFTGNENITSVVIPDSVKYIGSSLFYNCKALKTVTVPDSVISIGAYMLPETSAFEKVIYEGTKEQWLALTEGKNLCSNTYIVECSDGTLTIDWTRY